MFEGIFKYLNWKNKIRAKPAMTVTCKYRWSEEGFKEAIRVLSTLEGETHSLVRTLWLYEYNDKPHIAVTESRKEKL